MEKTKYLKRLENRNILLRPCELVNQIASNGITINPISISCMGLTIRWFIDILTGIKNTPDEYSIDGIKYQAFRDSDNLYFKEARDGGFVSIVGFTSREIQMVLEEFQHFNA
jgi:hypothetical protein